MAIMATLVRLIKLLGPFQDENQLREKICIFLCSTMQQREYGGTTSGGGWQSK